MLLNKLWRLLDSANSHYEKFADGTVKCIDDEIPFEIPQSWCWERWGNISFSIQYGFNAPAIESGDIKMVRISDIHDNKVNWQDVPYCKISQSEIGTYLLQENDILFARTGGTVGKSFLMGTVSEPAIYAGYLIRTRYSKELCPQYLKSFMESSLYWEQLRSGTIATAQPNCNGKTLGRMLLPIPPKNEQNRIISKLQTIESSLDKYTLAQEALDKLNADIFDKLKKSVLQEAIQGRLVPQDPNDEPVSVLLERIKEEKAKLFKDGKLKKKDLVDSVIFKGDDNKYYEIIDGNQTLIDSPFDFPESWQVVRLRSICLLSDGVKQTGSQVCLDAKYLRGKSSPTYLQQGKFVEKDDNIILVDGENSGEVFTAPIAGYMGSTFKQLWISGNLHLPYVLAFIRYYKDELRNSKKGAAIPHLNKDIFNNLIIGIPPYDEQVRIVDRLNSITSSLN